jgi:hypothetical protein
MKSEARPVSLSEELPVGLEEALRELGAGDSRFGGTSFGRGECDLPAFLQEYREQEDPQKVPADKSPQKVLNSI